MILYQEYEGLEVIREWWEGTPVTVWVIRTSDNKVIFRNASFYDTQSALNGAISHIHMRSYQTEKNATFAAKYGS
jgi:hypothetical protein